MYYILLVYDVTCYRPLRNTKFKVVEFLVNVIQHDPMCGRLLVRLYGLPIWGRAMSDRTLSLHDKNLGIESLALMALREIRRVMTEGSGRGITCGWCASEALLVESRLTDGLNATTAFWHHSTKHAVIVGAPSCTQTTIRNVASSLDN